MANIQEVIQQLRKERERAAGEVRRLDAALTALNGSGSHSAGGRTLSAAARARIAAAQRARWAKVRAGQKKPTMSAAAREKIAKSQRLRWAARKKAAQKAA
jgi:hypothetical protein